MNDCKDLSISILKEMLTCYNSSRLFAEHKLQHLTPDNPNSQKEIIEFTEMRSSVIEKITKLSHYIKWLESIETEQHKD